MCPVPEAAYRGLLTDNRDIIGVGQREPEKGEDGSYWQTHDLYLSFMFIAFSDR